MLIRFKEEDHSYTNTETKERYTSVTTMLEKYIPEFDSDYWSLYKAIKDVLTEHNQFAQYKISVGGWTKVVDAWRSNPLMKYAEEVEVQQLEYLLKWQIISEEACNKGTAEHKKREDEICKYEHYDFKGISYETPTKHNQTDILRFQDFTRNRVYTELLVYNNQHRLAGQVDWTLKKGKKLWLRDYKTSREITTKAFQDETMLSPLSHLPNANFYHYSMQLSTYGWMLEQCGYEVKKLEIIHTKDNEIIPVPYLKDEVERMVMDHTYAEI